MSVKSQILELGLDCVTKHIPRSYPSDNSNNRDFCHVLYLWNVCWTFLQICASFSASHVGLAHTMYKVVGLHQCVSSNDLLFRKVGTLLQIYLLLGCTAVAFSLLNLDVFVRDLKLYLK